MSEKGIVFFPESYLEATPKDYRLDDYENVFFPAKDGTRLHGWFVHGPDERAVLLWFHGNAGNISHRLHNLKKLHDALQIPVFMARRLFEKARSQKEFYEILGADHNDTYLVGGHEYFAVWQNFLIKCLNNQ